MKQNVEFFVVSHQLAHYLYYLRVTVDSTASPTRPIRLSDRADGNQLLTFQSLERTPFVGFMKLPRSILMTTMSCNGAHGKSGSTAVISKMSCVSYGAMKGLHSNSKGENYIKRGDEKKNTCQQNGPVHAISFLIGRTFAHCPS